MKIKFFGEGKTDISLPEGGDVPALVDSFFRKIMEDLTMEDFNFKRVNNFIPKIRERGHREKGYKKKVEMAMKLAKEEGCEAAVFVVDSPVKEVKDRKKELLAGRKNGMEDTRSNLPTALGLAVGEIEAWLLADKVECNNQLGQEFSNQIPSDIENLKDPKRKLRGIYGEYRKKLGDNAPSLRDLRLALANGARIKCLQELRNFKYFYEEVKEQILPLFKPK